MEGGLEREVKGKRAEVKRKRREEEGTFGGRKRWIERERRGGKHKSRMRKRKV